MDQHAVLKEATTKFLLQSLIKELSLFSKRIFAEPQRHRALMTSLRLPRVDQGYPLPSLVVEKELCCQTVLSATGTLFRWDPVILKK